MSKVSAIIFDGNHIEKIIKFDIADLGDDKPKSRSKDK